MLKLDPVDAFYSVGSSLLGRWLLFFSSGMVGLALGWVAESFEEWDDFLRPMNALENLISGSPGEFLMWLALWPVVSMTTLTRPWFFLIFALTVGVVFVVMIYTEEPAPLWWLGMVAISSLVPAMGEDSGDVWNGSSWLVLGVFWLGLGAAAFYVWRRDYPGGRELFESMAEENEDGSDKGEDG